MPSTWRSTRDCWPSSLRRKAQSAGLSMKRFSVRTAGLVVLGVDNFVPGNPDCIRGQAFFSCPARCRKPRRGCRRCRRLRSTPHHREGLLPGRWILWAESPAPQGRCPRRTDAAPYYACFFLRAKIIVNCPTIWDTYKLFLHEGQEIGTCWLWQIC